MTILKAMENKKLIMLVVLVLIVVGYVVKLTLAPPYPEVPTSASDLPNWYEVHTAQGVVNDLGTGLAQGTAPDEVLQIIQERRRDGLNAETCKTCHSQQGPGPWLYGNPGFADQYWSFTQKYEVTADKEEIPAGGTWSSPEIESFRSSR